MSAIRRNKGFTLIEILIVVIILGILAAIVIPQFSNASSSAKLAGISSTAQTLRTQVALYRLQHNDQLPALSNFWTAMTSQTDALGNAYTSTSGTGPFGPYMQQVPNNALNGASTVVDGNAIPVPGSTAAKSASNTGWVFDYASGTGSGRVYGTATDFLTMVP